MLPAWGTLDFDWPVDVNKLVVDGGHDAIFSVGQVVPHEIIGMANYNKNIFVGVGGSEGINKSHFLAAVVGVENILGTADNPVRRLFNYADKHFAGHLPICYILTVVGYTDEGALALKGLFIGDDEECFHKAAELATEENITLLDQPLEKVVVYMEPSEFKSTWVGNKGIYRTRMAIADGGELIVLAPGIKEFGEDKQMDKVIRKYGYINSGPLLEAVEKEKDAQENLGAISHLILGSSEDRFTITYCPGHLTREEIEKANFRYADVDEMMQRYDPETLKPGFNTLPDGETIYYIANPALGLWSEKSRFMQR
jgi:nickel-dependent lactate racemase